MKKGSISKRSESLKATESWFETERIIEALVGLKKRRKYPAWPGEILSELSLSTSEPKPKSRLKALREYLQGLGKAGVMMPSRKGRGLAYMLAGEDPRYARTLDNTLKFELLGEIDQLKGQLLEMGVSLTRPGTEQPKIDDTRALEEEVLRTITSLSRNKKRRTLDLWEVRIALPDVPRETLDPVLESLGSSWRIELQVVQDSTKLSPHEKGALLRLSDGTLIAAVGVTRD